MTKQHFESIAAALKDARPADTASYMSPLVRKAHLEMWTEIVGRMANVCAASNAQFKRDRFYDACGYTAAYGRS